mmetsp:Transcript_29303/g.67220  ORF Transcript_29303/g.67220 Transcript_29303/m.67220 type:complete len:207 (+) Transcript_29303:647-1267(+)
MFTSSGPNKAEQGRIEAVANAPNPPPLIVVRGIRRVHERRIFVHHGLHERRGHTDIRGGCLHQNTDLCFYARAHDILSAHHIDSVGLCVQAAQTLMRPDKRECGEHHIDVLARSTHGCVIRNVPKKKRRARETAAGRRDVVAGDVLLAALHKRLEDPKTDRARAAHDEVALARDWRIQRHHARQARPLRVVRARRGCSHRGHGIGA